jgi:hypothetical protein
MSNAKRIKGRQLRRIARLDRAWKIEGRREGRTENTLCWRLGQAYRAGITERDMIRVRRANG